MPNETRTLGADGILELARACVAADVEFALTAWGSSMEPTIHSGDRVLLAPIRRPLRRGMVVLTAARGRPTLHRIVRHDGDGIVTRGDARLDADRPCGVEDVIGMALLAEGSGRRTALAWTLRFGLVAWFRGIGARLRLRAVRVKARIA